MSLRALTRIAALVLGLLLATPLLWSAAGPPALLAAPAVALVSGAYLALRTAVENKNPSRWQIRYRMEGRQPDVEERMTAILNFLAGRGARLVLEANGQGLFLEAPPAYDRYIPPQLARALPEAKIAKAEGVLPTDTSPNLYLLADLPGSDLVRWATEGQDRLVRVHLHRGGCSTLIGAANGTRPPGTWLPLSLPRSLANTAWQRLPLWDEMARDGRPGELFPPTDGDSPYSSRSRLLRMATNASLRSPSPLRSGDCNTASFAVAGGDRPLGRSVDGQPVAVDRGTALLSVGAPAAFLVRQVKHDLVAGRAVVVTSPHRRVLNQVQREAGVMTYWLDQENPRLSIHLPVITGGEWTGHPAEVEAVVAAAEAFLEDLGLKTPSSVIQTLTRNLVGILAASAQATGNDFAFTDLYAVAQSTTTLKAFLDDLARMAGRLDAGTLETIRQLVDCLEDRTGYAQVTAVLSTMRTTLGTIRSGSLHALCRPPFLNAGQALSGQNLILVPMTNADFPEHNRFLAAMIATTLRRVLTTAESHVQVALHLHDPGAYFMDEGRQWLEFAGKGDSLALLLDIQDTKGQIPFRDVVTEGKIGQLIFRCDEKLAAALTTAWELGYTVAEMTEIPAGTALARLPGLPGPLTVRTEGA